MYPFCGHICIVLLGLYGLVVNKFALCQQESEQNPCPIFPNSFKTVQYQDKCFHFHNGQKEWISARNYCWQKSGKLATVNSEEMRSFLVRTMNSLHPFRDGHVWVGLNDISKDGHWKWVGNHYEPEEDLSPSMTHVWRSGFPRSKEWYEYHERNCVTFRKNTATSPWRWENYACNARSDRHRFICEYDLPPTTANPETTSTPALTEAPERPTTFEEASESTTDSGDVLTLAADRKSKIETFPVNDTLSDSELDSPVIGRGEKSNHQSQQITVPGYAIILAPVAAVFVLVVGALIILRCRRRPKKDGRQHSATHVEDIYLDTSGRSWHRGSRLAMHESNRGACANAYEDHVHSQLNIPGAVTSEHRGGCPVKKSNSFCTSASPRVARQACHGAGGKTAEDDCCTMTARSYPMLDRTLSRGKLPELPPEAGYEVPLSLRRINEHPQAQTEPRADIMNVTTTTPDEGATGHEISAKSECNLCGSTEQQDHFYKNISAIYEKIPDSVDPVAGDTQQENVYQQIPDDGHKGSS